MENTLTPQMITEIYASTSLGVAIMLAAAGLGSALGWGLICMKYIEGIARQPEMLPALRIQMFMVNKKIKHLTHLYLVRYFQNQMKLTEYMHKLIVEDGVELLQVD